MTGSGNCNAKHSDDRDRLTQITAKVPRWVEDKFQQVCRDTGLVPGQVYRITMTEIAKILESHWRKGPALGSFLEHLEFNAEQYNIFFEPQRKQTKET